MSDFPAAAITVIPSLAESLARDLARKAVTIAATAALAHGLITADQEGQFVSVGVAIILYAVSMVWTFVAARARDARLRRAIAAPAATPAVKGESAAAHA